VTINLNPNLISQATAANKERVTSYRNVRHELSEFFYLQTDGQEKCFKKNIKIYIKTAPTCFGLITIIRERIIRAS